MDLADKTLHKLKQCIRENRYIMTLHAEEEMDDDELSIFDIEHAVLTGEIIEKQKDYETSEWKYVLHGKSIHNNLITVVVKISPTGKMVIITVYRDEMYVNPTL